MAPESHSCCRGRTPYKQVGGKVAVYVWVREVEVLEQGEEMETDSLQLLHFLKVHLPFQLPKHIFDFSSESGLHVVLMYGFVG